MRTQIFTDKELEKLDSKLLPLSPHNLVEVAEIVRHKHYAGTPQPVPNFDLSKAPCIFGSYQTLWKYAEELNEHFGRMVLRPQACLHINSIIETEISLDINVRDAIILQDREAREKRKTFLYKIRQKIVGKKYEDAELERIFVRLNTPALAKSLAGYNWGMVNMAYYPKEMRLHAKLRKTTFDLRSGKPLEDLIF